MRRKKRYLTLLEIMIAIFLITLITGAIGYNMKGTLEKGKAFRTEQAQQQLIDLLTICLAEGADPNEISAKPADFLKRSGLAKDPDSLVRDGWKQPFQITLNRDKQSFRVRSKALEQYNRKHNLVSQEEDDSDGQE